MKVVTTTDQVLQFRNDLRRQVRLSDPRQEVTTIVNEIRMDEKLLVAKHPELIPECNVCKTQSNTVIMISDVMFCKQCLSIALAKLGEFHQ